MEDLIRFSTRATSLFNSIAKKTRDVEISLGSIVNDQTKDYIFFRLRGKIEGWLNDIESAIRDISKEHAKFILESKSNFAFDQAKYFEASKILDIVTEGINKSNELLDNSYKMFMNATYSQQYSFVLSKVEKNFEEKFKAVEVISSNVFDLSSRLNILRDEIKEVVTKIYKTEKIMDDFLLYSSENFLTREVVEKIDSKLKNMSQEISQMDEKIKIPQFKSY